MSTGRQTVSKLSLLVLAAVGLIFLMAGSPSNALAVDNPPLGDACGFDVVLVMDESGSIDSTEFAQMQAAMVSFVEALNDTPTEFALVDFGTLAYPRADFQANGGIITAINSPREPGTQWTNWQEALDAADDYFHPAPPFHRDNPDLVIFASDGNPTAYGNPATAGSSAQITAEALARAIVSADHLKSEGIRIMPIAIGDGLSIANMEAISGPGDVIQSDFDQLAQDLAQLALVLCGGTITAHKVIDEDGNPATTGDQSDAEAWTFAATVVPPDFSTPPSGETDSGGKINFDIDLGGDGTATVSIAETLKPHFDFISAGCVDQNLNPVGTTGTGTVTGIVLGPQDIINCTFYNNPDCSYLDGQCAVGVYNPATGNCEAEPSNEGSPCNDGQYCTNPDTCQGGVCTGPARGCDDANLCTDDSCDEAGDRCVNTNNALPCNDGNACTTADTCSGGSCVGGAPPNCNDGNVCTNDSCNPVSGCVHTNNTLPCDDGNACSENDVCVAGSCMPGPAVDCNDGNVCTNDSCNPVSGCVHTNNTALCDDGNACTANDTCSAGSCVGVTPLDCNDGNLCTNDSCHSASGCVYTNNATPCDDGNACTTNDTCSGGACVSGAPRNCNDGNVCTNDSCNPASGCVHTNNTLPCNDGNACTTNDTCSGGSCVGGAPPNCNDGNLCTDDSCNPVSGCVHTNNTAACDDGLYCTVGEVCQGGACTGVPRDCGDGNGCTEDSCNEAGDACVNDPVALNGAPCDDGLFCTEPDTCQGGTCGGPDRDCDAEVGQCYRGECNELSDVCDGLPIPDGTACDDGDICTADDVCASGECRGTRLEPLCGLDHQKCYRVQEKGWRFKRRNVMLEDQFGRDEMEVVSPKRFCNPAEKDHEGIITPITDPGAHMACYKISRLRGQPAFETRQVVVNNQFGESTLSVIRADSLCLPALKDDVPSPLNIDHFKCYKARVAPKTARFRKVDVAMEDQFEDAKVMTVVKPKLLCNPVDKNGEGIRNPDGHLVCYRVKTAAGQPKFEGVTVENIEDQFSSDDGSLGARQGDCRGSSVICVPSTKRFASPSGAFLELTSEVLD